jgi:hypothetical protein
MKQPLDPIGLLTSDISRVLNVPEMNEHNPSQENEISYLHHVEKGDESQIKWPSHSQFDERNFASPTTNSGGGPAGPFHRTGENSLQ